MGRKEPSGRESRTNHAESHGLGAAVRKIEGDTPRRAVSQPNSCVSLEGNPRRCTELFVLGLRLTLASHGDLDVGDRLHAILRPLKEVTAAVAMALGETSIWEISSGAAQGGGWRIGNTPTPNLSSGNRTV